MEKKIIVVGGVAGGATAVARMRRLDENAEIILFEKGAHVSFANCGLPYYIGGVIANRDLLFVSDKQKIEERFNVDVRIKSEVLKIDKENKTVEVKNLQTGETYLETYDKLVLATGSRPFLPTEDCLDHANVFTLWNMDDTDSVFDFIQTNNPQRAVIVGGGFIGIEVAENLIEKGLDVTLIEMAPQVMAPFDPDMSIMLENQLRTKGVDLRLNTALDKIENGGKSVKLGDGSFIDTDLVILSIGIRPNSKLARDAELELNQRGGIVVDKYLQTSDPHIYAVGDVIEVENFVSGLPTMVPLAGPANKQGRIVADNILRNTKTPYRGTQGTSIAKVFDLCAASTGQNEKTLNKDGLIQGKDYSVVLLHPMDHAAYYPGAMPIALKLIFCIPDGKILGAQAIGYSGVDKRIDVIATAMNFNASVYDLQNLELAYAPPYSSAKDPVNMAGYMAVNMIEVLSETVSISDLDNLPESTVLLSIQEPAELMVGSIPDSLHIPLTELRDRWQELDPDKEYIVYCRTGNRSYLAERILKQKKIKVKNLAGGYTSYLNSQPVAVKKQDLDHKDSGSTDRKNFEQESAITGSGNVLNLDVCGLSCPGPIVQVSKMMETMSDNDILEVKATDPGFARDIESWCENTGNTLLSSETEGNDIYVTLRCNRQGATENLAADQTQSLKQTQKEKTMIVFSGDLDKAIASFIIATGAAAMGNKVNMFFTFWGLSVIRKTEKQKVKKNFISKMFSMMLPRGSKKLKLSQMNFLGAGSKMIRSVMKSKNIDSLEDLIKQAQAAGVKMTGCQMSMDVMGITQAELIDGVEVGGVASMLNDNDNSNMNLFI